MLKKLDIAILKAKWRMDRFLKDEGGMETLETVILIVVAVVIAGTVIAILGRGKDDGILGTIFNEIQTRITKLFDGT